MLELETCPGCGTRPDEWPTDDDGYLVEHYVAESQMCWGCKVLGGEQERVAKHTDHASIHTRLVPREYAQDTDLPVSEPEDHGRFAEGDDDDHGVVVR